METSFVENLPKKKCFLLIASSLTKLLATSTRFIESVSSYGRGVSSHGLVWNLRVLPASTFSLVLMLKRITLTAFALTAFALTAFAINALTAFALAAFALSALTAFAVFPGYKDRNLYLNRVALSVFTE